VEDRPREAFKPVMLSSMRISEDQWDAQSAFVGSESYEIPSSGWIVDPPAEGTSFGLEGGSSAWKENAPTVEIEMEESRQITGWIDDTNGDVGFWTAADEVLSSWEYTIEVRP
jgi:hypothetical protein